MIKARTILTLGLLAAVLAFPFCNAAAKTSVEGYAIVYSQSVEDEEGIEIAQMLQEALAANGLGTAQIGKKGDDGSRAKSVIRIKSSNEEKPFEWSVKKVKKGYEVSGGSCWALSKAASVLASRLADDQDVTASGDIYGEQLFARTDGCDLRILDDNIWQYDHDTIPDPWKELGVDCRDEVRYKAIAEVVLAFMPDIFTMQEYSAHMDKYLAPELEKYGYVNAVPQEDKNWNYTPIYYNKATISPLESRYNLYTPSEYSNKGTKSYTSGVFMVKSTGKTFCLVNTHLWWKGEKTQAGSDLARASQIRLCMAEAEKILAKYSKGGLGMPAFMVGDMNCTLHSIGIQQLLDYGYLPLQNVATVSSDRRCGHHVCGPTEGFSRETKRVGTDEDFYGAIDHFMVYAKDAAGDGKGTAGRRTFAGAEVKVFGRIQPYFTIKFTDHYPNYADIKL